MNTENQVTNLDIYNFIKINEKKNADQFDMLKKEIKSIEKKHEEIMIAIEALFYNNRNDFAVVESQFRILESKILKAMDINSEDSVYEEN